MKDIPGYEGLYSATLDGKIYSHKTNKFLKPVAELMPNGYVKYQVSLSKQISLMKKQKKTFKIPRLMMLTYVGERPEGMEVCHNDGDSSNNALSNLRYDTRGNNMRDCVAHGTWKNQFTSSASKISD